MRCSATNKEGNPCDMAALKGEQFCIAHSDSERAKKSRMKRARSQGRFDKNGHLTLRGFLLDLKWARNRLMADPKTSELQRAGVLKMLDVRILKTQELIRKQKSEIKRKIPSGTVLIKQEEEGKIIRGVD